MTEDEQNVYGNIDFSVKLYSFEKRVVFKECKKK